MAEVEERLDRIAGLRRRYRAADLDELLARRDAALPELEAIAGGADPVERARSEREVAQRGYDDAALRSLPRGAMPRMKDPGMISAGAQLFQEVNALIAMDRVAMALSSWLAAVTWNRLTSSRQSPTGV